MLMERKQLKDWFYSPWPNRDLDMHFNICIAINVAMSQSLVSRDDMQLFIQYLVGVHTGDVATVKRVIMVIGALASLQTDEQYCRNVLPGATDLQIQVKVAEMEATSIYETV
jgi:hypothetical protein